MESALDDTKRNLSTAKSTISQLESALAESIAKADQLEKNHEADRVRHHDHETAWRQLQEQLETKLSRTEKDVREAHVAKTRLQTSLREASDQLRAIGDQMGQMGQLEVDLRGAVAEREKRVAALEEGLRREQEETEIWRRKVDAMGVEHENVLDAAVRERDGANQKVEEMEVALEETKTRAKVRKKTRHFFFFVFLRP